MEEIDFIKAHREIEQIENLLKSEPVDSDYNLHLEHFQEEYGTFTNDCRTAICSLMNDKISSLEMKQIFVEMGVDKGINPNKLNFQIDVWKVFFRYAKEQRLIFRY